MGILEEQLVKARLSELRALEYAARLNEVYNRWAELLPADMLAQLVAASRNYRNPGPPTSSETLALKYGRDVI